MSAAFKNDKRKNILNILYNPSRSRRDIEIKELAFPFPRVPRTSVSFALCEAFLQKSAG